MKVLIIRNTRALKEAEIATFSNFQRVSDQCSLRGVFSESLAWTPDRLVPLRPDRFITRKVSLDWEILSY